MIFRKYSRKIRVRRTIICEEHLTKQIKDFFIKNIWQCKAVKLHDEGNLYDKNEPSHS